MGVRNKLNVFIVGLDIFFSRKNPPETPENAYFGDRISEQCGFDSSWG